MKYSLAAIALAFGSMITHVSHALELKDNAPIKYEVKQGDTLWDISALYLKSPWHWKELWQWNRAQVSDPNLIFPGDILQLKRGENGEPFIMVDRGIKKLSPRVRLVAQKGGAIPTLSLPLITPFLRYEMVLSEEQIDAAPVILGASENMNMSATDGLVYVKANLVAGGHYAVYRQGERYTDPETGAKLAHSALLVGSGRVIQAGDLNSGLPARLKIDMVKREIRPGDIVMPLSQGHELQARFSMTRPDAPLNGFVIANVSQMSEVGALEVVVLNRGHKHKLKEGHILDISRPSPTVIEGPQGITYHSDASSLDKLLTDINDWFGMENDADGTIWHMPSEKVGELMVFKVYDDVSYAMVMRTTRPIRVGDSIGVIP